MPKKTLLNLRELRQAFRVVVSVYSEVKMTLEATSNSTLYSGMGFAFDAKSKGIHDDYTGKNYFGGFKTHVKSGMVRASASDFVADVEIAIRRAFTGLPQEAYFFKTFYQGGDEATCNELKSTLSPERFKALKHSVQTKLGRMLCEKKIFPIQEYMKPLDLR